MKLLLSFVSGSIGIDGRRRGRKLDCNWMKLDPISRQFRLERQFLTRGPFECLIEWLLSDKLFFLASAQIYFNSSGARERLSQPQPKQETMNRKSMKHTSWSYRIVDTVQRIFVRNCKHDVIQLNLTSTVSLVHDWVVEAGLENKFKTSKQFRYVDKLRFLFGNFLVDWWILIRFDLVWLRLFKTWFATL